MSHSECQGASERDRWWEDPNVFAAELVAHGNVAAMKRAHPHAPAERTLRDWRSKHEAGLARGRVAGDGPKIEQPTFAVDGDSARFTTEPSQELGDVADMICDRGLNPDEWDVERVKVNEWDAYAGRDEPFGEPRIVKLRQLTVHLKRRRTWDFLVPATPGRVFARPTETPRAGGEPRLEWVGGDQQAPYHDAKLHEAVCLWLRDVQPDGITLTGDTTDLPTISRHADRPHWNAAPQDCIDSAYGLLYDYRDAAPDAIARKLRGNHDWRIESEILTRAERMWGLRPATRDGEDEQPSLYSIRRLLRLDELAIELVGREGDKWELAEIELAPGVSVRHAPPSQAKLVRLNRDVVSGHTHRQSIRQVTIFNGDAPTVRTAVETGCLCRTDGLGYDEHPDWQPGFATVTVWPDGTRGYELARWDGRALTWRGETWKP